MMFKSSVLLLLPSLAAASWSWGVSNTAATTTTPQAFGQPAQTYVTTTSYTPPGTVSQFGGTPAATQTFGAYTPPQAVYTQPQVAAGSPQMVGAAGTVQYPAISAAGVGQTPAVARTFATGGQQFNLGVRTICGKGMDDCPQLGPPPGVVPPVVPPVVPGVGAGAQDPRIFGGGGSNNRDECRSSGGKMDGGKMGTESGRTRDCECSSGGKMDGGKMGRRSLTECRGKMDGGKMGSEGRYRGTSKSYYEALASEAAPRSNTMFYLAVGTTAVALIATLMM